MLNKKNNIIHLVSLFILCVEFALCRYTFLEIHGMKQLPGLLFGVGMIFLVISFLKRGKMAPIVMALAYLIGFVAGVVFETEGIDAGGGTKNNLWIIFNNKRFNLFNIWLINFISLYSNNLTISNKFNS